jgi:chromosome segregation ATPase
LQEALRVAQQESRIKAVELMQRENDILELKDEIAQLSKEREQELIDSLRAEISALSDALNEKDSTLSHSSSAIVEKDTLVAKERARLEDMQSLIDRLKVERAEREKELQLQQEECEKKLRKMGSELTAAVSGRAIYVYISNGIVLCECRCPT